MDGVYRWQRHIYDLTRKYYLLGRDRLIDGLDVPQNGSVLELGCGTGRNIVLAARRYPNARFFGLDISAEMLETASAAIEPSALRNNATVSFRMVRPITCSRGKSSPHIATYQALRTNAPVIIALLLRTGCAMRGFTFMGGLPSIDYEACVLNLSDQTAGCTRLPNPACGG